MSDNPKHYCAICLLGPPASCKGTVATMLRKKYDFEVITPGAIYRRIQEEEDDLAELVRNALKDGGLAPDWLTNKLVLEEVKKFPGRKLIFDGYPRSLEQFRVLQENFEVGLYLDLHAPYHLLEIAATSRCQCKKCNEVMSLTNSNTWCQCVSEQLTLETFAEQSASCDNIVAKFWTVRADDTPEMFYKRFQVFLSQTKPVIEAIANFDNYRHAQVFGNKEGINEVMAIFKEFSLIDTIPSET